MFIQPLFILFLLKLNGSETDWNKVNVESNDQTEDEFRFETYKIDNLKSQTSYEVRIEATNKFGSTWSEPFSFVTSGIFNNCIHYFALWFLSFSFLFAFCFA